MASIRFDVVSIGTLSRNRLWNEAQATRTAHSTTTLIRTSDGRHILVDPGLPAQALAARLYERTGLLADRIDTIFLTNSRAAHRRGLDTFFNANVLIHELEQQSARARLETLIDEAPAEDLDRAAMERELDLLNTWKPAPDKLCDNVDLFPLFGYTPGNCGLLLALTTTTVLIAGDAVPTAEHFLAGQTLADAQDLRQAQDALAEVYEIADLIIPGHDNLFINPRTYGI